MKTMGVDVFLANFREAFGEKAKLPLGFWYSDQPVGETEKIGGCMFKFLPKAESGVVVSLSAELITCGGGKFYCGFTPMPERVPVFVAEQEKYKESPRMVVEFLEQMQVPRAEKTYLNFARLDKLETFEGLEGIMFMATPDVLSGLAAWAYFDNNDDAAVSALFGSGCGVIITQAILENRKQGRRTFLGGFDPSARPLFGENELSFTIPLSRFREMYDTMRQTCLFDTHDWERLKKRINQK